MTNSTPSCTNCRNVGRSHSTANGLPIVLHECRHPDVKGLMRCESCNTWNLMENFGVDRRAKNVRLRCPEDGCRHTQSIPKDDDSRVNFLGFCSGEQTEQFVLSPPTWCPGMLQLQTAADAPKKADKPKRLTKKQRREAEQPSLFG